VPSITNWRAIWADRFGILPTELYRPEPVGFTAGGDSAFGQKVFNISQAQAETEVQPDSCIQ